MHVEVRRQLVGGVSFLPVCEFQAWNSGPQTRLQAPSHSEPPEFFLLLFLSLNAASDSLPVYAGTLQGPRTGL